MKSSMKDFFNKYDQIRSFQRILSHLLKKSFMKNSIFSTVKISDLVPFFLFLFLFQSMLPNMAEKSNGEIEGRL